MNDTALRQKLNELTEELSAAGRDGGADEREGLYVPSPLPEKVTTEQSLDHVRMQLKYLLFDLEATRRENHYLREMLENRWPRKRDDDSDDNNKWK